MIKLHIAQPLCENKQYLAIIFFNNILESLLSFHVLIYTMISCIKTE